MCTIRLSLVGLLVGSLVGCGGPSQTVGAAIPDSVAYACTPVLVPGPDDDGEIGSFAPGPDGLLAWTVDRTTLMIGPAMDQAIRVGRAGEGPGEFSFIDQIGWAGDTLWASDLMQARIQFFDRTGALIGGHRVPPGGGWQRSTSGQLMALGSKPIAASGWSVLRMSGDSTTPTVDTVFHFPGPDPRIVHVPMSSDQALMTSDPFLPDAAVVVAAGAGLFCGSEPLTDDDTRIRCVDDRGTLTFDSVLTLSPQPLSDRTWNSVIGSYLRGDAGTVAAIEGLFTHPDALPRVTALGVDRNGALWIDRSWYSDSVQHWLRLTPTGALRDTLLLTRGHIAYLAGDTLWRESSDADGMEMLERCVSRRQVELPQATE